MGRKYSRKYKIFHVLFQGTSLVCISDKLMLLTAEKHANEIRMVLAPIRVKWEREEYEIQPDQKRNWSLVKAEE